MLRFLWVFASMYILETSFIQHIEFRPTVPRVRGFGSCIKSETNQYSSLICN
jgi:hypothetical protein